MRPSRVLRAFTWGRADAATSSVARCDVLLGHAYAADSLCIEGRRVTRRNGHPRGEEGRTGGPPSAERIAVDGGKVVRVDAALRDMVEGGPASPRFVTDEVIEEGSLVVVSSDRRRTRKHRVPDPDRRPKRMAGPRR